MFPLRALLTVLVLALGAAGMAAAATPDDLSRDPLDRAAILALPSVYALTSTVELEALETRDGRRIELPPQATRLVERGTAFAVAPDGILVTAAHVAAPTKAEVARDAYLISRAVAGRGHSLSGAADWVERTGARPVGMGPVRLALAPAHRGPGAPPDPYAGRLVAAERERDLAIVDIDAPGAPALELDGGRTRGTPVMMIGFGGGGDGDGPRLEEGRLGLTGTPPGQPDRFLTEVDIPVERGDSGGPVVDVEGGARGIVLLRFPDGGWVAPASEIRKVADAAGVELREGATAASFRSAMRDLWALDLEQAKAGLDETLDRFPQHTLAAREADRADALASASYALAPSSRRSGFLMAVGVIAIVGALACALRLGILSTGDTEER